MLVQPLHDYMSMKRSLPGCSSSGRVRAKQCDDEWIERCCKRPRLSPTDLDSEQRLCNLKKLGPEWIEMYSAHIAGGLSATDAYWILALVSTIGSPRVLADLATMRSEFDVQVSSERSTLLQAYANLDGVARRCIFLKRRIAMFVCRDYDSRLEEWRYNWLPKKSKTKVLDQLEKEYHPFKRRQISIIRDKGRKPARFRDRLGIPNTISLLPAKAVASFLDPVLTVSEEEYVFTSE